MVCHHTMSNKIKFNFLIILFGKMSSSKSLPSSSTETESKVAVAYGRNFVSDLASNNDVTTNGVNGRIGYKTWWKCECCAPMETSIEGVCCLEIPEICKPRFSSTSCLNVCRLDPHFELWYSRRENVVSYLISTQCWSLANQNKSFVALQTSWLSFSVKHFTLLMRSFSLFSL